MSNLKVLNRLIEESKQIREGDFSCELKKDETLLFGEWYSKKWISYRLYLELTGLPF